jgi:hypothetical protein
MIDFIKKYFTVIVLILVLIGGVKSCADSRKMDKILKGQIEVKNEVKTTRESTYTKQELDIRLQIEGLKSEKRMIQSTDRKLWDMNRQSEIDGQIKLLEEKLQWIGLKDTLNK